MFAPIYEKCQADPAVRALLGDPIRLDMFGEAPQEKIYPYAVWQTIGGEPNNNLADAPTDDEFRLQVDVYGKSASSVRAVAVVLRNCIEQFAFVESWRGEAFDAETDVYRFSFDVSWLCYR
ncbi:DUF3168 domain-containing protein [Cellvibrio sp. KY-GH-1]|uniref:DUF3168 domain-containing protein n=1 Tax=Cellvibrio sp. KY-GH-1 TaxID=2303332 RepID=UPI0012476270|nr:DUF3168 domain-containing protein [Cellvibrio sp. KY-GH-1]QEY15466.1 DUF3168 domain-containing protein [Cellvibrio sp. KY-GH-1]